MEQLLCSSLMQEQEKGRLQHLGFPKGCGCQKPRFPGSWSTPLRLRSSSFCSFACTAASVSLGTSSPSLMGSQSKSTGWMLRQPFLPLGSVKWDVGKTLHSSRTSCVLHASWRSTHSIQLKHASPGKATFSSFSYGLNNRKQRDWIDWIVRTDERAVTCISHLLRKVVAD